MIGIKLEELKSGFDFANEKNESMCFGCKCTIVYSGKAEAYLSEGDRIIIIKNDKTLLVHQPQGSNPVNYMRNDSSHEMLFAGEKMILKSRNIPNKEYLDVTISKAYFFESYPLEDGSNIQLSGTEKDMADMIFKNPEVISPYFKPLSREDHNKYGFVDVLGYENKILTVIECKRSIGDPKAVDQLRRYVETIKNTKGVEKVQGILACPKLSSKAEKMLADYGFGFVAVKPPSYHERYEKSQKKLDSF